MATEKMASGRQKVADSMLDKIAEESKQHRKEKEAAFKRVSGYCFLYSMHKNVYIS